MEETFKLTKKGKKISCGIILADGDGRILAGHPTGRSYDKGCYDLLKGCADSNEDDLDCAIREMKEESGFNVAPYRGEIKDLGLFNYNKEKVLHLFLLEMEKLPSLLQLWCDSQFTDKNGRTYPEMNGYKIIGKNEREYFFSGIQKALKTIKEIN